MPNRHLEPMSPKSILAQIAQHSGRIAAPSPMDHLAWGLQLQRLMVSNEDTNPDYENKATFFYLLNDEGQIAGLNLSHINFEAPQKLSFLKSLAHLEALNLCETQLTEISIPTALSRLKYLNLADNSALQTVEFSQALPELLKLELSHADLAKLTLPSGFAKLWYLNTSYNKRLREIDFEGNFPKLKYYYTTGCALEEIKLEDKFPRLRYLFASENALERFYDPKLSLPELLTLELKNNKLTDISADFLKPMPQLINIGLTGNPLNEAILSNIANRADQDLEFIKRYTAELGKGSQIDRAVKILLLGNGGVGKSVLAEKMVSGKFNPEWDSTHAIVLKQYPGEETAKNEVEPYVLNIWDFGGQDIYHATHRLFMQTNAIYIILWDAKTEEEAFSIRHEGKDKEERKYENFKLNYWLSYAQTLGEGCPVLIVQTKIARDEEQYQIEPEIRKRFKKQLPYLEFSYIESKEPNFSKSGYKKLFREIKNAVEECKQKTHIPDSWALIQEKINRLQKQATKRLSLTDFETVAQDYDRPREILRWLTQTGIVFFREHLFNNDIILDQEWAIEAVYTLFRREEYHYQAIRANKGTFTGQDLMKIWNGYTIEEQKLFVSFMLSCQICFETTPELEGRSYRVPYAERSFVAPQLLPDENPSQDFWEERPSLYLNYVHEFLHYGIIQSFIVQTHTLATNLGESRSIWKSGILIKKDGQYAQIEAENSEKIYIIKVRTTENAKRLLDAVRNEFDKIQQSKGKEFVSIDGKRYVDLQELELRASDQDASEIKTKNGSYMPIHQLTPFLNRNVQARLIKKSPNLPAGSNSIIKSIKLAIGKGELESAMKEFLELCDSQTEQEVLRLMGKYSLINKEYRLGKAALNQYQKEHTTISDALLFLLQEMEMEKDSETGHEL